MPVPKTRRPSLKNPVLVLACFILILSPLGRSVVQSLRPLLQPLGTGLFRLGIASSPFSSEAPSGSQLDEQRAVTQRLERENQQLRALLDFRPSPRLRTVGADIVGRSVQPLRRLVYLNRGSSDGLSQGQAVLAAGYVVGTIDKVAQQTAEVQLVTDPDFRMTVTVGENRTAGIARGSLGGMSVSRLLQTEQQKVGDHVFTSSVGGLVPNGLPVGIVRGIREKDSLFREVDVELPVGLEQLQVVTVVTGE
jgi:rod shape-determining protein MreC